MTINGLQVTRTWRIARYTWPDARNDFSYFHSNGTCFYNAMPITDDMHALISIRSAQASTSISGDLMCRMFVLGGGFPFP